MRKYYLYRMGHRKIAYVGTLLATEGITDRYFGYQKALLELGLEQKKEWVLDDRHIETGKIDTVNMLQIPKDMPTAFVCNCDLTASFLIKKLKDNGYRVPEDIPVVGFDNYLHPGLSDIQITTHEVDLKEMANSVAIMATWIMYSTPLPIPEEAWNVWYRDANSFTKMKSS